MKHHSQGKVLRKQELKGNTSGMKHKMHRTGGDEPAGGGGKKQTCQGARSGQEPPGVLLGSRTHLRVLLFLLLGGGVLLSTGLPGINMSLFEMHWSLATKRP